jgi:hypothetical protein
MRSIMLRVFAWLGLAASLVLAIAILIAWGWAAQRVERVFNTAEAVTHEAIAVVDAATGQLDAGTRALEELLEELGPLPSSSTVPAAIAGRISNAIDAYTAARDQYVEMRAQARSALRALEIAGRFIPAAQVPDAAIDALLVLDSRLEAVDDALGALRGSAQSTAGDVVATVTWLHATGESARTAAQAVREHAAGLPGQIAVVRADADRALAITTIIALTLVGYIVLLNVIIMRLARRPAPSDGPPPGGEAGGPDVEMFTT